jgi:hypothetical protein
MSKERQIWDDQKRDGLAKSCKKSRRDNCGNRSAGKDGGKKEEIGDYLCNEFYK